MQAQHLAAALRAAADINEYDGRDTEAEQLRFAAGVIDRTLDEMDQMRDELAELREFKARSENASDILSKVSRYFPTGLNGLEHPSH